MKSYINILADYTDALIEWEVVIPFPKEELAGKLKAIARAKKQTIEPGHIEKGDVVCASLKSGITKYNRDNVFITVGGGIFNTKIEDSLTGRMKDDSYVLDVDGKTVMVTVKEITRTVFPEPDDEMLKEYVSTHREYEGIESIRDFKKHIIDEYFKDAEEKAYYDAVEDVLEYLLTHSDFEFSKEEIASVADRYMQGIDEELQELGKPPLGELSENEIKAIYGMDSKDELAEYIYASAEREIAAALILSAYSGNDMTDVPVDEINYIDQGADQIEEYVREKLVIKEDRK